MWIDDLWRFPYGLASRLRIAFYRSCGMGIGAGCRIESIRVRRPRQIRIGANNAITAGCWFWPEDTECETVRIEIGDSNYFNRDVIIDACGSVRIGSHCMFGPRIYITDSNHTLLPDRWVGDCPMERGRVVLGDGCWIGAGATILKDVHLGEGCVVGAGAVVTKSFPAGSIIAGIPGRMIRSL